ncbi:hypothetical protein Tco_0452553 [Tanacetum coccineum]
MRTRSQTRNRNRQQQSQPAVVQPVHLEEPFVNPSLVPMADNRTMAQLLQAPTEGYEDAIVISEINANFELKHGLINLLQNKQIFGHDKEDPHAHIRYFNKITSTMRFPDDIPITSQCLVNLEIIESKSKVRNSRNKAVVAKVSSNSSTPGISPNVAALTTKVSELKNMMKTMLIDKQKAQAPALVKAVEQSCVTCGVHSAPLVPTSVVSIPLKEPVQNPETSMDKVQKPSSESTVQRLFLHILIHINLNFHIADEDAKKVEKDTPSAQQSRFMKLFKQLRLEIGLRDALIEMLKFNKWLSTLLRNKEKLEEIAITTVNAECSTIILNKVPEKLEDPGKFLIPCALQELDRTNACIPDTRSYHKSFALFITKHLRLGA